MVKPVEYPQKKLPKNKLPSLSVQPKLLDNKYKYIKDVSNKNSNMRDDDRQKYNIDDSKTGVLFESTGKLAKIKESSKAFPHMGGYIYEESIDVSKKDGWRINLKKNPNESFAYGGK